MRARRVAVALVRGVVWAGVLGVLLGVGGCAGGAGSAAEGPLGVAAGPFAPESVRVFPLTHFDTDAAGQRVIVLHLELKDRWGHTVKGAGRLSVGLLRATGVTANEEAASVAWEVDLTDGDRNAAYFNPSSRTYRVPLGELPSWLEGPGAPSFVTVAAVFRTASPAGAPRVLRDEYRLAVE